MMRSLKIILCLAAIVVSVMPSYAQSSKVNIVFIGNSITYGAGLADPATEAPPVITANWLRKQKGIASVNISNQGHSGYTTLDFLPGTPAFNQAEDAARQMDTTGALLILSIKLGTNDSAVQGTHGAPVAPENYIFNLKALTNRLLADFPKAMVIYQHPVWYSPNTYNGAKYLQEGLDRLQSYIPLIDTLAAGYSKSQPTRVFVGDTKAFKYFRKHHLTDFQKEDGRQGAFYLHPNKKGAVALGEFWGKAIYRATSKRKH